VGWFQTLLDRVWPKGAPASSTLPTAPAWREGWFDRWLRETEFLARYPAYAGVLARLDPVATRAVRTMAVALQRWDDPDARLHLLVNLEYFAANPEFRAGVLLHEIQHVMLGHLGGAQFHAVRHPKLMELAMEISANEYIREPLPPVLDVATFAEFGVAARQSTRERYALLVRAYESGALCLMDWWSARMVDAHRPRRAGASGGAGLGDFLDARSDGATERNWNREPGLGRPTDAASLAEMKRAIRAHVDGARGGALESDVVRARLAKELERFVIASDDGTHVDWRRVLREAFPRRRLVHPDYLRPNRRFPTRVGEIPGRSRRPPKPRLLVGVDTSGSMNIDALSAVADEIVHLSRHARLTIVECDAAVHRTYALTRRLGPFVGGGDTDFAPVFDAAQRSRYDGVVYFTDGKGAMPETLPALPTLWAVPHDDPFDATFGSVVRLGLPAAFGRV
jgi:predicted metal-dependent peptidase